MNFKSASFVLNMCRTCMTQFSKTKRNGTIKNQNISEVPVGSKSDASIMEILQKIQPQIKVDIEDNLPTLMCNDCIEKLLKVHDFIEMYRNSDKNYRKMLNYSISSKDFVEIVMDKDHTDEKSSDNEKEDEALEVTEYKIEIEEVNLEEMEKVQEESDHNWAEFEEEPLQEMSDEEGKDKETLFENPYSDASDNEWMPEQCRESKTSKNVNSNIKVKKRSIKTSKIRRKIKRDVEVPVKNEDGSITCPECQIVLDNIEVWQEHIEKHRLENKPKRKYTKKSNVPRKNASKHKVYKCEYCDKEFSNSTSYKNHLRTHTGEQPYLCIECGKSFKVASSLNTHMLRHKGEKNIQCPHCPKKFVCSSGLYGHMMMHTKEKPFVCDICGSAFHQAYQLRKHNLYHNGIKKYQCEYCDMKFVTGEKQRRHMRTHTGEKPYRCKYCERAFAQSNDCIKHLRQHLGDNVYQCELCPQRFPLLRDLRAHFANHKDDDEETRKRNLEARLEEERKLQIKLGIKDT